MRILMILTLMLPVAGCVTGPSDSALCDGTVHERTELAAEASLPGVHDGLVIASTALIMKIDAGCDANPLKTQGTFEGGAVGG